jgi:uncharacterized protein
MQWEGDPERVVPLVALDRGAGLVPLEAPPEALGAMAGYVGSVAVDRAGELVAASCPRGSRVAFWRAADGRFLRTVEVADGCAVGPAREPGRFVVASGLGLVLEVDARTGAATPWGERAPVAYDNHLTVL